MNKKKIILKVISKILNYKIKEENLKLRIGEVPNWDSLNHIKIYLELSKIFKYKGSANKLAKIKSIQDWINYFK